MKIAFVVDGFPKLSDTFILNQVTGLLDLGFEVRIFAHYNPGEDKTHPDVDTYGLMERVSYIDDVPDSKFHRFRKAVSTIVPKVGKNPRTILKSLNIFSYGREALSLRLLFPIMPFLDVDIIHCHFGYNALFGAYLKKFGVRAPLITTVHGYDMSAYILEHGKDVYDDLFHLGDRFLPISEYWKEKLIQMDMAEEKITVHRMGIELEKFHFQERKLEPGEPIKLLTVGRLVEKKGHEYAVKGIAQLISKHPNVTYTIAGDGPLRETLERLVAELHIDDNVRFLGSVDQDEVVNLYKDAHIFLLTSVTAENGDQEGIPVVLMEAQAVGLPIVSTYHSGIPELVEDGRSGFLVPERDSKQLAEKLIQLAEHPHLYPEMGARGRKIVEEKYNIEILNRQLVEIFQTAVGRGTVNRS